MLERSITGTETIITRLVPALSQVVKLTNNIDASGQTDDPIHDEPEQVHTRQPPEQAFVSVAAFMGRSRPMGGAHKGSSDQGVLSKHISC